MIDSEFILDFHNRLSGVYSILTTKVVEQIKNVCESPIEMELGSAIYILYTLNKQYIVIRSQDEINNVGGNCYILVPQYKWGAYRSDWAFIAPGQDIPFIVIECDGHEFHERTKEQASRDRNKDREAQIAGFVILRFTGSEIRNDIEHCLAHVISVREPSTPVSPEINGDHYEMVQA